MPGEWQRANFQSEERFCCQGLSQDHKCYFIPPSTEDTTFFKATFQEVTMSAGQCLKN